MTGSPIINIFRGDAFSNVTMTRMINKHPYVPMTIGKMNLFEPNPILTDAAAIDRLQGILTLIPTSPRGAPPDLRQDEKRDVVYVRSPRLARKAKVRAEEIANVRSYDEPLQLMTLQEMVARKLMGPTGLTKQVEYTWENHRLGAIMGGLVDANGQPIPGLNFNTVFNTPANAPINFDLKQLLAADQVDGALRIACTSVVRTIMRKSQGCFIEGESSVVAICGDNFYDALNNHPDVVETLKFSPYAKELQRNTAFMHTPVFGIDFINYRGSDDGVTVGVNTNRCQFFPKDAPGVFSVHYAPGETFDDVNKPGEPMYVYNLPDPSGKNAFVEFEVNSFPLHICNRPEVLFTGLLVAGS